MTSFAFILGVVPLYMMPAGPAPPVSVPSVRLVFWGMLIGTILSVFLVPLFYVIVRKFFKETAHEHEWPPNMRPKAGAMMIGRHSV